MAFIINIGVIQYDRILMQVVKKLFLITTSSLFLRVITLSIKYYSKALILMNLIYAKSSFVDFTRKSLASMSNFSYLS